MDIISALGYAAAFLTTFSFLPQAIQVIKTKNTDALSFTMYSMFTVGVGIWLAYGLLKADYAIVAANLVTLLFAFTIWFIKAQAVFKSIGSKRGK
jgi:MtN3 and saliva related transmembrane protein